MSKNTVKRPMNRLNKRRNQVPILRLPRAFATSVSGSASYSCSLDYPMNCQILAVTTVRIKVFREMTNMRKYG